MYSRAPRAGGGGRENWEKICGMPVERRKTSAGMTEEKKSKRDCFYFGLAREKFASVTSTKFFFNPFTSMNEISGVSFY